MILNLSDLSDEPLQSQIYRQIRAMILAGDLKAREMLPSIRALAREERVSVITVQRGYEILERENLIISRRGKGFFVSEIHDLEKKNIAENRFKEKIGPIVDLAKSEGLSLEEIEKILIQLIQKRKN